MTPGSAKAKGRTLQKWLKEALLTAASELEPDDIKSTSSGATGEDLLLSPAARRVFPYSFECKNRNSIAVYKWLEQAESNTNDRSCIASVVVAKQNRDTPIVILRAEDFIRIIKELHGFKKTAKG